MGDLDFDELDKAVNSLMGKVDDKNGDDENKEKTLAVPSTLKQDEKVKYDALGKAAQGIGDETLDAPGERTVVEDLDNSEPKSAADSSDPVPATPEPSEPKPVAPAVKRPSSGRFMDMVHPSADMRGSGSSSGPAAIVPPAPVSQLPKPDTLPSSPAPMPAPAATPPLSPFLPDAKVEKRPLGGPSADDQFEAPQEDKMVETEIINNDERPAEDTSNDEQRPLDPAGFDVEAAMQDRTLQSIESADAITSPAPSVQTIESGDTGKVVEQAAGTDAKDQPGGIYDTQAYHQPISHPPKQRSGWGVVVIILVIIVLSVAAAGAAYLVFVK